MRLTDIPAFFTATPKTSPTPAIAIFSVPVFNNTIASTATLSLQQRWAELELKSSVDFEISVGFNQYNYKTMYRSQILQPLIRDSHENCIVYQILLGGLRHHDEHLADEEKYKTYYDIPIGPIYINLKYFHSGSTLSQNSHLYSTRFFKEKKSKYINKRVRRFYASCSSSISTFVHYASKNEKKVVSNIAVIVTIVRLLKMYVHTLTGRLDCRRLLERTEIGCTMRRVQAFFFDNETMDGIIVKRILSFNHEAK
ncbi:uncharacterized protein EV154DRAFT_482154 [Mucor mucedo]|uniref:uncharacterized protein n=1 Tax=Mucor mucedo TaxID=29922 RepID=UPI00221F1B74|nr:uncharacterized protein EV154DRAFT_482154 [Mucor mucedo]KAI7890431.1 hypothetical protein EV154DRAFT_482154 [Mucor mucedo]